MFKEFQFSQRKKNVRVNVREEGRLYIVVVSWVAFK